MYCAADAALRRQGELAKLAVGDAFQTYVFLELDDLGDGFVFNHAKLRGRDVTLVGLRAGFKQEFGAQKTAHVVVSGGKVMHKDLHGLKCCC